MGENLQISIVLRTTPFTLITPLNRTITSVVKLPDVGARGIVGEGGRITDPGRSVHFIQERRRLELQNQWAEAANRWSSERGLMLNLFV